jgi:arylsulfatase
MAVPLTFGAEGSSCGYNLGEAKIQDCHAPLRFTRTISKVTLDISGRLIKDEGADRRVLKTRR